MSRFTHTHYCTSRKSSQNDWGIPHSEEYRVFEQCLAAEVIASHNPYESFYLSRKTSSTCLPSKEARNCCVLRGARSEGQTATVRATTGASGEALGHPPNEKDHVKAVCSGIIRSIITHKFYSSATRRNKRQLHQWITSTESWLLYLNQGVPSTLFEITYRVVVQSTD